MNKECEFLDEFGYCELTDEYCPLFSGIPSLYGFCPLLKNHGR